MGAVAAVFQEALIAKQGELPRSPIPSGCVAVTARQPTRLPRRLRYEEGAVAPRHALPRTLSQTLSKTPDEAGPPNDQVLDQVRDEVSHVDPEAS